MSTLQELRETRLNKITKLRALGINPFPSTSKKEYSNIDVIKDFSKLDSKTITVAGRIVLWRPQGAITFAHISDQSGKLQIFIRKLDLTPLNVEKQFLGYSELKLLDIGDFIEVTGVVKKTSSGEISVMPGTIKLLAKAIRPLPDKWQGVKDPEIIFRKRYLDLIMNQDRKELFIRKAKFWQLTRQFLQEQGFMEVETPVLELATGGADAKPFITHHNALDQDFYMRISTELFQKRLIGGGFEKIYTLGPNFRNEGIDDEHLQEYYQCEWYWAYADYTMNMDLVQTMFQYLATKLYGKTKFTKGSHTFDLAGKWPRLSFGDLIKKRFSVDIFNDSQEKMLELIKAQKIDTDGLTNRSRIVDNLWKIVRREISGPIFIIDEPKFSSPLAKSRPDNIELTERFHAIIAGSELGNGYSELNDPVDQLNRFLDQQKNRESGDEESQMLDIDFVEMLEYGMPPVSGWGHSERVFWFLEDITAREGTFFPQMKQIITEETRKIYNLPEEKNKQVIGLRNNKIVIGKIESLTKHPNADKLNVCQINIGTQNLLNIVCGAPNIKAGDIVPVSIIGALVFDEEGQSLEIAKVKLRGIESEGMLCSRRELGLGSDHSGIYILPEDLEKYLGQPVNKYLRK